MRNVLPMVNKTIKLVLARMSSLHWREFHRSDLKKNDVPKLLELLEYGKCSLLSNCLFEILLSKRNNKCYDLECVLYTQKPKST